MGFRVHHKDNVPLLLVMFGSLGLLRVVLLRGFPPTVTNRRPLAFIREFIHGNIVSHAAVVEFFFVFAFSWRRKRHFVYSTKKR
jgi:hypothetical protein